jgi:hypothetical protein
MRPLPAFLGLERWGICLEVPDVQTADIPTDVSDMIVSGYQEGCSDKFV